jgi:hypothetical protein
MKTTEIKELQQFLKLYAERVITLTEFVKEVTARGHDVVTVSEVSEEDGKGMCYARTLPIGLSMPIESIVTPFNR